MIITNRAMCAIEMIGFIAIWAWIGYQFVTVGGAQ